MLLARTHLLMPGAPRTNRYLHLVRLDDGRMLGWQLRLPLWHPLSRPTTPHSEMFSDSKWGGQATAFAAARQRRDELFARYGLPLRLGGHTCDVRSTTGLTGVTLAFDERRLGLRAFSWKVKWSENGRQKKKSFGLSVYGFDKGLTAAVKLRQLKTGVGFSRQQLTAAAALRTHVEAYVLTGKPPAF